MKDQKLLKTLIVIGLATTLAFSASAFVGCDNSKTQGGIVDPPIIVVDPPEPDKPIIEPDEPIIEPDDPVDEPDDPVIDEPDEPVIEEPDDPVIEDPDQPDNPPEEEEPEKLTEAEIKENENRIYQYVAKADNSGWELDSRGNPVEVFNKEGVRAAFNEYMNTDFENTNQTPLEGRTGKLENLEQIFTNYEENEKYQMGYIGDYKTPDNYGNTKAFVVIEMPIDLDDCNNSIEELTEKLSETKPREISTAMTYSYSYSNLDREYRSNRTLSEALKDKLFGDYSDDEIIFEMYAEVFDGGIGHDFGNFMSVPMACITLENDSLTLRTASISSSMFYDGWEENLLESEVVGTDCINADGERVCVLNYGDPKSILTIDDNFYDADDEIVLSANISNSRSNLKNIYTGNKERAL